MSLSTDPWTGPLHWRNVYRNGIELAEELEIRGKYVDTKVIALFAIFHDLPKPGVAFGQAGAELAHEWRLDGMFLASKRQMDQLIYACIHHEEAARAEDPTIGACWDADRYDQPRYLYRHVARESITHRYPCAVPGKAKVRSLRMRIALAEI